MRFTAIITLIPFIGTVLAAPITDEAHLAERAPPGSIQYGNVKIVNTRSGKCVSPNFVRPGDSAYVFSVDCSQARTWDVYASGAIVMHDYQDLALDAGSNPSNNGALKVWKSYPGLYQQTWALSMDQNRNLKVQLRNGNQCLDEGPNGIQTYQCYSDNKNQLFRFVTA